MKQVIIVRHGKAEQYGYDDDFNRKLTSRGKKDARLISDELKKQNIFPETIISSPAKRAMKTARIFAENLNFNKEIIIKKDLYEGLTTVEFLHIIQQLPESTSTVMLFGHNPNFHYFVCNLLEDFYGDMPTTSTVGINFDVKTWQEIEARDGKLAFHLMPRMFK